MRYVIGVLLLAAPAASAQPLPAGGSTGVPTVVVPPGPPLTGLRGPFRVRFATAATDVIADTTMRMLAEVPRAIGDSVRNGNAQFSFRFNVTRDGQPAEATPAPPAPTVPSPPAPSPQPQPRRLFPRR